MTAMNISVGDELPSLVAPQVNRATLALFAGASGDHNPIHIDLDFARKAGMSDVFVHGMLSMAYLGRLITQWIPQAQIRQFTARFTGITHLGNQITCSGKVAEITELNGERLARIQVQSSNQYGEVKVLGDALIAI